MTAAPDLRRLIAARFPDAVPLPERQREGIATGVQAWDRLLPGGGLPRGRPTLWDAGHSAAATALLAHASRATIAAGWRTAWIDGSHTLGPGWVDGPLVLRPRTPNLGLSFAELLLDSGGFALVVMAGVPLERTTLFRLARAAHEGGGAFAVIADGHLPAALTLRSNWLAGSAVKATSPSGEVARLISLPVSLEVTTSGMKKTAVIGCTVPSHEVRQRLTPGLVDRRGAG